MALLACQEPCQEIGMAAIAAPARRREIRFDMLFILTSSLGGRTIALPSANRQLF
jgi:hypothetical protein